MLSVLSFDYMLQTEECNPPHDLNLSIVPSANFDLLLAVTFGENFI